MNTSQQSIDQALLHGHPRDVAESVKESVAKAIAGVNRDLEIRKTDYFNHTYFPDLVTWWGPNDADHREVFLRFDSTDGHLALDIERLSRDHPMFYSLQPIRGKEASPDVSRALSKHRQVMVTGTDAINELAGSKSGSFESLVLTSVVKAGRGLVDQEQAAQARADAQDCVEAALTCDEPRTRTVVTTTRSILADSASQQIEKYLQLLWLAGGGQLESYPGDRDVGVVEETRDVEDLIRLMLRSNVVDDARFWRRFGAMVTLSALEGLGSVEPLPNLQHLVNANTSRLFVSYAAASEHEPRLISAHSPFYWLIVDSRLCLEGSEWRITFADDGRHFIGVKKHRRLLTIDEVSHRASGFEIEAVELEDETFLITVEPKIPNWLESNRKLDVLNRIVDHLARVRSVTVRSGAKITIEFNRRVASIQEDKIALPELAEVAVALMTASNETERTALLEYLSPKMDDDSLIEE